MENESNVSKELHDLAVRLTVLERTVAALGRTSRTHTHRKPATKIDLSDLGKYVGYTCDGCGRFVAAAPEESVESTASE